MELEVTDCMNLYIINVELEVKNLPANAGDLRFRFDPRAWKAPWRRAQQATPLFLPGESHGQKSLEGHSP